MSNKTIAKNTLFLYIRMLFNMGAMLYISRVVLRVLGVEDFGIYNIVMGVVILFSFFNGTMTATTQRFINVEKASNDSKRINKVFNISILNHLLIMLIVVILAETVGLWFLNHKLIIPAARMQAANIVYQVALVIASSIVFADTLILSIAFPPKLYDFFSCFSLYSCTIFALLAKDPSFAFLL